MYGLFNLNGIVINKKNELPREEWPLDILQRCLMDETFNRESLPCFIKFGHEILTFASKQKIPATEIRTLLENTAKGGPYKVYCISSILPKTLQVFAGCMKRFYFREDGSISAEGINKLHELSLTVADNKLRRLMRTVFLEEVYSNQLQTDYQAIVREHENNPELTSKLIELVGEEFVSKKFAPHQSTIKQNP